MFSQEISHSNIFVPHQDKNVRNIIFQLGDNFFFSCSPGFTTGTEEKLLERKVGWEYCQSFLVKK